MSIGAAGGALVTSLEITSFYFLGSIYPLISVFLTAKVAVQQIAMKYVCLSVCLSANLKSAVQPQAPPKQPQSNPKATPKHPQAPPKHPR